MMTQDSTRLKVEIELVRREAESRDVSDADGNRYAQLATIWVSGYLEASCREVLLDYTRRRADPAVVSYVGWNLARLPSPRIENIATVIGRFDQEAAKAIRRYSEGDIKDSVNDIVESRHAVAHGRKATITLERVFDHFDNAVKLTNKMKELLA